MVNGLSLEEQLEQLLNQDVDSVIRRTQAKFDRRIDATGESFVLFGAGRLGRTALSGLRKMGIAPYAFADNNPSLWNTAVDGLQVLSPQEAIRRFTSTATFVITVYTSEPVRLQLGDMNVEPASFASLAWKYPKAFLPHGAIEPPWKIFDQAQDVRSALDLWTDDRSKSEYLQQLAWRTSLDPSALLPHLPADEIYFADDLFSVSDDEVFVDCGAFDGDTIRSFLRRRQTFERIIALEPDPVNFERLKRYRASLPAPFSNRITALRQAVGSDREMCLFNATGTAGSAVGSGAFQVECVPLDEILVDTVPTLIKMDIEGAESVALEGARRTLARHLPVLSICLYHAQEHLWRIPLLIRSISSQYKLFLRRYSDECWELVCYAVPADRLAATTYGEHAVAHGEQR